MINLEFLNIVKQKYNKQVTVRVSILTVKQLKRSFAAL